ncbi:MAG TPA: hypothetical protein VM686_06690, partial [Polyangiaceae bacterium]|nr:hypothetical protein [Polyangiaceae bacterium]
MVINEKPVSWTIALAVALVASCGKTTEDAGSQQDPIPGAACDGTQSRLSSDGCLDCTCEADHWNCIELCSSEGGQGGSLGTDVAKGGKGGRTWDEDDLDGQAGWHMGGAPPAGCEIDS